MKHLLNFSLAICMGLCTLASATADTVVTFGDLPLAPDEISAPISSAVSGTILGIDVAFNYEESQDGSWSSDYYAIIVDPSGDTVGLGDGLGDGDIDYDQGLATGADGSQNDTVDAGSYGTFFDIGLIQAFNPNFGEAGTYTVSFADGWGGGGDVETLFNATVTFETEIVPEPTSAVLLGVATLGLVRRRRK